ncbi:MAG: chromosome segregation ATPase [Phycisphaerales bacterium]
MGHQGPPNDEEVIMGCIGKTVVRAGVIAALVGGTAVVIAGPHRVGAVFHQTQNHINQVIDSQIDDPIALREQIKRLEAEYPKKISQVRSDLAQVQQQTAELDRELKVATRVVALASADLNQYNAILAQAQETQSQNPSAVVKVSFEASTRSMNMQDAYSKRTQIDQTRQMYTGRAADLNTELGFLSQQEKQLAELLTKLETERAEFQSKLFQLDAQIDSIARNERLIEQLEDRQATIDKLSRYESHSLDQLSKKLNTIRAEQRSRIESIAGREQDLNYEDIAQFEIDSQGVSTPAPTADEVFYLQPESIEVGPQDVPSDSVASR